MLSSIPNFSMKTRTVKRLPSRLDVVVADIRLPEGEDLIDTMVATLETNQDRFSVVSVSIG